jgi:hypothetical protein
MAPKLDVTVAVRVTDCPTKVGDPDVISAVDVVYSMYCIRADDVLPWLFASPEYLAVIE